MSAGLMSCVRENSPPMDNDYNARDSIQHQGANTAETSSGNPGDTGKGQFIRITYRSNFIACTIKFTKEKLKQNAIQPEDFKTF